MKYLLHTHFDEIFTLPPDMPRPQQEHIFALDATRAFHEFYWENAQERWDYEHDFADIRPPQAMTWIEAPAPRASNENNMIRPTGTPLKRVGCLVGSFPLKTDADLPNDSPVLKLLDTLAGAPARLADGSDPREYDDEQMAAIKARGAACMQQQQMFGLTGAGELLRLHTEYCYLDPTGCLIGKSRRVMLAQTPRVAALNPATQRLLIKEMEAQMLGFYYTLSLLAEGRATLAPGDPPKRTGQIPYQRIKAISATPTGAPLRGRTPAQAAEWIKQRLDGGEHWIIAVAAPQAGEHVLTAWSERFYDPNDVGFQMTGVQAPLGPIALFAAPKDRVTPGDVIAAMTSPENPANTAFFSRVRRYNHTAQTIRKYIYW